MKHLPMAVLALFFSSQAWSLVSPQVKQSAMNYDYKMCVATHTQRCISLVCITSEYRDCQERCQQGAFSKCEVIFDDD